MRTRRMLALLALTMLAAFGSLLAPTSGYASDSAATFGSATQEASATWDAKTGARLAAWACSDENICFFTGRNGTGSRCMWSVADPDWAGGAVVCSWALTRNVASVMNLGFSSDGSTGVAYYRGTNYSTRAGCTKNQHGGNLAGTYKLRSHKWISGSCG